MTAKNLWVSNHKDLTCSIRSQETREHSNYSSLYGFHSTTYNGSNVTTSVFFTFLLIIMHLGRQIKMQKFEKKYVGGQCNYHWVSSPNGWFLDDTTQWDNHWSEHVGSTIYYTNNK